MNDGTCPPRYCARRKRSCRGPTGRGNASAARRGGAVWYGHPRVWTNRLAAPAEQLDATPELVYATLADANAFLLKAARPRGFRHSADSVRFRIGRIADLDSKRGDREHARRRASWRCDRLHPRGRRGTRLHVAARPARVLYGSWLLLLTASVVSPHSCSTSCHMRARRLHAARTILDPRAQRGRTPAASLARDSRER